ncbi:hypothetical protein [Conexibacter woesei]|uniref:Uncharacterized protein n=1 Tax=Conexibacter woesei (strain DSM 14684 / CCUG 47730 / CIP 108061 / JCM 11494 / NBRC 100937 / ID131577) TaxID=469383 RepID=D3F7F3_CONWI|nr:hypothetical protein [Conexibacter woesei]ADB50815.1 hypothetical protein Cwoe_2391 [Conexibacter woesei DSM 14684]
MIVQRVLKGICGIDAATAEEILRETGIVSNWWRGKGSVTPEEALVELTEPALLRHLNDYVAFGPQTPFISTTAGSVVRDASGGRNDVLTADHVATDFATDGFTRDGWVFSGYVFTLGRKAVTQEPFAEEVRELHVYTDYLRYQPEGELVAKIQIPAVQLEAAWPVTAEPDPANPGEWLWPSRGAVVPNDGVYVDPLELVNVREAL